MTKGFDLLVRRTSRRNFLIGAGGVAVALPFLTTLTSPRRANAWTPITNGPKRLLVLWHPHGLVTEEWWPKSDGSYGKVLKPIADAGLSSNMLVLGGIDHKVTGGHEGNAWTALTCRRELHWGPANWQITGAGPSVEHVIGRLIADGASPRRLDLRVPDEPGNDVTDSQLFWAGAEDPISQQNRPQKVFDALFGTQTPTEPTEPTVDVLAVRRKSVLDGVLEQFNRLRSRVAVEDRQRLDVHADKIRTIESGLSQQPVDPGSLPASCGTPPTLGNISSYNYQRYAEAHADLMVHALACGAADVGTYTFSQPGADQFAFLNQPGLANTFERGGANYHGAWHLYSDAGERGETANTFTAIGAWKASIVARMMRGLSEIDEGGRSALENTMIVWFGEFGNGGGHAAGNLTVNIAGNFGGVTLGRHLSLALDTQNPTDSWRNRDRPGLHQLAVSMLNAFNSPVTTFGDYDNVDEEVDTGPLPRLT